MSIATTIKIGSETVDLDNPCDVAIALRKAQLRLATGTAALELEIDGERVRYASSNDKRLTDLIAQYTQACQASQGRSRRRRRSVKWS